MPRDVGEPTRTLSSKVRYFLRTSILFPNKNTLFKWTPRLTLTKFASVYFVIYRDVLLLGDMIATWEQILRIVTTPTAWLPVRIDWVG